MVHRCHNTLSEIKLKSNTISTSGFISGQWLTKECVWSQRPETIGAPNCIIWGGTFPDFQSCWIKLTSDGNSFDWAFFAQNLESDGDLKSCYPMPVDPVLLLNFVSRLFDNNHSIIGFLNTTSGRTIPICCNRRCIHILYAIFWNFFGWRFATQFTFIPIYILENG